MVSVILAEDRGFTRERHNNYVLLADGREGCLQEPGRLTLYVSPPSSCSRHCTPHLLPTPSFLVLAFLAYLPPTIGGERGRWKLGLALGLCLCFSLGCPP